MLIQDQKRTAFESIHIIFVHAGVIVDNGSAKIARAFLYKRIPIPHCLPFHGKHLREQWNRNGCHDLQCMLVALFFLPDLLLWRMDRLLLVRYLTREGDSWVV